MKYNQKQERKIRELSKQFAKGKLPWFLKAQAY